MPTDPRATFDRLTELDAQSPTLIEGLPGHGLVASIAVDQITTQLELEHYGNIRSDEFPPVATYQEGRVRDPVRVYGGADPAVMTLQSDLPIPPESFRPLSECVFGDLASEFGRAIFLAGSVPESEDRIGEVLGIATTDGLEADLREAGVELASGSGLVGGVTGGLLSEAYYADVPAAVLVVKAHPYLPDPGAAQSVIENALEPLVDFDIDTGELRDQADEIQRQKEQIAQQFKQLQQQQGQQQTPSPSMYQ
jgi:uncharacterized protein